MPPPAADAALARLSARCASHPDDDETRWQLLRALQRAGQLPEALAHCAHLLGRHPRLPRYHAELARLHEARHDWLAAHAAWQQLLAIQPHHAAALAGAAHARMQAGEAQAAVAELTAHLHTHGARASTLRAALLFALRCKRWHSVQVLAQALLQREADAATRLDLLLDLHEARLALGLPAQDLPDPARLPPQTDAPTHRRCQQLHAQFATPPAPCDGPAELPQPVDVVYTWVDGSDPAWLARFQEYTGQASYAALADSALNAWRYEQCREIQFSLQCLARFFPQVRQVFILTDHQTFPLDELPESLRSKIRFVFHPEVMDPAQVALPTFNSSVIEVFLDRIPGLADTFLYFNDDTFLGRPLRAADLFAADGRPIQTVRPRSWPTDQAAWRRRSAALVGNASAARIPATLQLFQERLGYCPAYVDNHQFRVRTREQYRHTLDIFGAELQARMFASRTRRREDVRIALLLDWMAGHAGTHCLRPASPRLQDEMQQGLQDFDWEHAALLLEQRPRSICLNIGRGRQDRFAHVARHYLADPAPPPPADPFLQACVAAAARYTAGPPGEAATPL